MRPVAAYLAGGEPTREKLRHDTRIGVKQRCERKLIVPPVEVLTMTTIVPVCEDVYYHKNQCGITKVSSGVYKRENKDELIVRSRAIDASAIGAIPVPTEQSEPRVVIYDAKHVIAVGVSLHLFKVTGTRVVEACDPLAITGDITGQPGSTSKSARLWCVSGTKLANLAAWKIVDVGVKLQEIVYGSAIFVRNTGTDVYIMFGKEPNHDLIKFSNCAYNLRCEQSERDPYYTMTLFHRTTRSPTEITFRPDGRKTTGDYYYHASASIAYAHEDTPARADTPTRADTPSHAYSLDFGLSESSRTTAAVKAPAKLQKLSRELTVVSHKVITSNPDKLRVELTTDTAEKYAGEFSAYDKFGSITIGTAINFAFYGARNFTMKLTEYRNDSAVLELTDGGNKSCSIFMSKMDVPEAAAPTAATAAPAAATPTGFTALCTEHGYMLECTYRGEIYSCYKLKTGNVDVDCRIYDALMAVEYSDPNYDIDIRVYDCSIEVTVENSKYKYKFLLTTDR